MHKIFRSVTPFIILGLIFGILFDETGKNYGFVIKHSLFLIMFFSSLELDLKVIQQSFKNIKKLLLSLGAIYIIIPILTIGLAWALRIDSIFIPGIIFAAMAPPVIAVTFFAKQIGGDSELSFVLSSVTTFIFPVIAIGILLCTSTANVEIDIVSHFFTLSYIVVLPFILSIILKKFVPKYVTELSKFKIIVTQCSFLAFMFPIIAINKDFIFTQSEDMFLLIIVALFQEIGVFILSLKFLLRGFTQNVRKALALCFSIRNTALTAGIAVTISPEFAIPSALVVIVHIPMFLILDYMAVKSKK